MTSRTSRSTELLLLSAALLAQCAGCAASRATDGFHPAMLRFASDSVSNVVAGNIGGTAVYLGDGRWITSRHVLESAPTVDIHGSTVAIISIDGNMAAITVLRRGEPLKKRERDVAQGLADWVIFEAPGTESAETPACYDPDLPIAPGQEVYLIGYPCAPGTMDRRLTLAGTQELVARAASVTGVSPRRLAERDAGAESNQTTGQPVSECPAVLSSAPSAPILPATPAPAPHLPAPPTATAPCPS